MKNPIILFKMTVLALFTLASCSDDDQIVPITDPFTLQSLGVATGVPITTTIEAINKEITGIAFTMDFFDGEGQRLGSVTDINVSSEIFADGSMKGENYTIFNYDDDQSTLVLHNFIDMTPINEVTLQATVQPKHAQDNVVGGTGRFAGKTGGATLDAILDMTKFNEGTIGFDCVYKLEWK